MASFPAHPASNRETAGKGKEEAPNSAGDAQELAGGMEELRRLQLAHEGMRLLLSSEVKRAEQLFRSSR